MRSRTVQELRVVGVRVELPGNQPILLLKETQGERYLPIWIGAVEAAAIAFEQQGVRPARPMTHDLLREVVRALGATLEAVNITEMRDGIYIAELVFGDERVVSARPSDAVALAVRTGAPIFGADDLLDEVGIEIPDEQEDEVEKFREFLDQISPEDFGAGSGFTPGRHTRASMGYRQGPARTTLEMMSEATRRLAQLTASLPRLTVGEQQRCDT
jgi:bifunctional DNase/RNase